MVSEVAVTGLEQALGIGIEEAFVANQLVRSYARQLVWWRLAKERDDTHMSGYHKGRMEGLMAGIGAVSGYANCKPIEDAAEILSQDPDFILNVNSPNQ